MKARIHIFYKDSVFDPQGNTVADALKRMGFGNIQDVRVGKVVDITFEKNTAAQATKDLQKMCEDLLANPVIESFKYEVIEKT